MSADNNQTPTQAQLLEQLAAEAQTTADSRKLFHKIGLWGNLNAINQHHGLSALATQRQLGSGVAAGDVQRLMDTVPFGGSVTITNIGMPNGTEQPRAVSPDTGETAVVPPRPAMPNPQAPQIQQPQQPQGSNLSSMLTTGAIALLAGAAGMGIPAAIMYANQQPTKATPAINGELELEIPFNVNRNSKSSSRTESSGRAQ